MENKTITEVLVQFGEDTIAALHKSMDDKGVNATYKLRQSVDYEVRNLGTQMQFKLGWTGDANEYASAADTGRRPGKQPPLEPIMKWIAAKGIALPDESALRKRVRKSLKSKTIKKGLKQRSVEQRSRSLAYLIARKIGKEGTKPSNFYSDVVKPSLFAELRVNIAKAFKQDVLIELKRT